MFKKPDMRFQYIQENARFVEELDVRVMLAKFKEPASLLELRESMWIPTCCQKR